MDILAHGLTSAAAAGIVDRRHRFSRAGRTIFWGVFPDLFAFFIPLAWLVGLIAFGDLTLSDWPDARMIDPTPEAAVPMMRLAGMLYSLSHSLPVFIGVFLAAWLVWRKAAYPMLAWLLHIVTDIPTHSAAVYPTPVLFPFSDWVFPYGVRWAHPVAFSAIYAILALTFATLYWLRKRGERASRRDIIEG